MDKCTEATRFPPEGRVGLSLMEWEVPGKKMGVLAKLSRQGLVCVAKTRVS